MTNDELYFAICIALNKIEGLTPWQLDRITYLQDTAFRIFPNSGYDADGNERTS